jgi:hypothetical protein
MGLFGETGTQSLKLSAMLVSCADAVLPQCTYAWLKAEMAFGGVKRGAQIQSIRNEQGHEVGPIGKSSALNVAPAASSRSSI